MKSGLTAQNLRNLRRHEGIHRLAVGEELSDHRGGNGGVLCAEIYRGENRIYEAVDLSYVLLIRIVHTVAQTSNQIVDVMLGAILGGETAVDAYYTVGESLAFQNTPDGRSHFLGIVITMLLGIHPNEHMNLFKNGTGIPKNIKMTVSERIKAPSVACSHVCFLRNPFAVIFIMHSISENTT